jgi:acyl carrier protein
VVIGDDVWVAHGALLEPGTVLGNGSVVVAGAVVSGEVPPRMLAFGNPAQYFPLEDERTKRAVMAVEVHTDASTGAPSALDHGASGSTPSRDEVRAAIIEWLDDTRHFGEAASLITSDAMSLREGGLLDSLGLVDLVLMLEQRFAVKIDREFASRPGPHSMNHFVDLVTSASRSSVNGS